MSNKEWEDSQPNKILLYMPDDILEENQAVIFDTLDEVSSKLQTFEMFSNSRIFAFNILFSKVHQLMWVNMPKKDMEEKFAICKKLFPEESDPIPFIESANVFHVLEWAQKQVEEKGEIIGTITQGLKDINWMLSPEQIKRLDLPGNEEI
jgi:hypothetical protein